MSQPPGPPRDRGPDEPEPEPEEPTPVADRREEFARETARAPRDRKAERAFLQKKIETLRADRTLPASEKEKTIAALLQELARLPEENPGSGS
ncbi:hypothetical protein ACH4UT_22360 [Streptomyces sp. NPDC020799]|uniref:hypothetical protein n=1 Tax=Streptomyces sp. NPDC020799 TaxID=3365091 RepID=UPI0037999CCC